MRPTASTGSFSILTTLTGGPPEMVVEILQAIHLLLAYKLFVVIVSIDPRRLLKSLGSSIPQMQSENDAQANPAATP